LADEFRIDSHKLILHPERVLKWLRGESIYPICMEISPSGSCNHRCVFCGLDYLGYKPVFLDKDLILKNLKSMKEKGLKSIVAAGEGEPLLNKNTPAIINEAKSFGLDVAMSSNGVLFSRESAKECLASLTWIRFSVNAGSDKTHQIVHRGGSEDFSKALANIENAVAIKRDNGLSSTIGVQMLLIPENSHEVVSFAKKLKEIGVDYFTVKPFSKHPKSTCIIDPAFDYRKYLQMDEELKELNWSP
jgi:MoaA/NifB/PqqE/SkfB family radical SAM enzyme